MKPRKKIMASSTYNILGTYEGEVLDTNITNKNGLDITRAVMESVFKSEDYQQGIKNGWFIGFLGHPEDPNCMDFEHGCIVMTDGYIDDNGKVHGKFNLIDTPVGQIVKKFQEAGVTFGISIRGAGDIINNSVEPDSFIFRGFDLVSFPAYPESIPEFTSIAASTNLEDRKKYQAVCASVNANINNINNCSTIDVLQTQFAPQSKEYKALDKQRQNIVNKKTFNIDKEKVDAMTDLYLQASAEANQLAEQVEQLKCDNASITSAYNRKVATLKRITGKQTNDILKSLDSVTASRDTLRRKFTVLTASCDNLREQNTELTERLNAVTKTNLIYKQKIESSTSIIEDKKNTIIGLQKQLRETVTASSDLEYKSSNLGDENKRLNSEIRACKKALHSFQKAYVNVYASALGVNPELISFSDTTSVAEIQKMISSSTNTGNIPSTVLVTPVFTDDSDDIITM